MWSFGIGHWAPAMPDEGGEAVGQVADLVRRRGERRSDGAVIEVRLGLLVQRRKRHWREVRVAFVHLGHRFDHLGHHHVMVVVVMVVVEVVQVLGGPACRCHQAQRHADAWPASLLQRVLPVLHLHLCRAGVALQLQLLHHRDRLSRLAPKEERERCDSALGCSRSLTDRIKVLALIWSRGQIAPTPPPPLGLNVKERSESRRVEWVLYVIASFFTFNKFIYGIVKLQDLFMHVGISLRFMHIFILLIQSDLWH